MPKTPVSAETLAECAVHGMQEKKAKEIVKIDLRELGASVADFFVICHGDSDRQVEAIADSVVDQVRIQCGEKPFSKEGMRNAEWIILDYVNVVVHVFKKDKREFYGIEDLWGDGIVTNYPD
ncbi:MAG: ribosome silencing factor [Flavobacteriales bacterium]|nr:ribosome silencing factor [Flavobacteriales bacterium]